MSDEGYPKFVFEIWCRAWGDLYISDDYPRYSFRWFFLKIWGYIRFYLFGWWWYRDEEAQP